MISDKINALSQRLAKAKASRDKIKGTTEKSAAKKAKLQDKINDLKSQIKEARAANRIENRNIRFARQDKITPVNRELRKTNKDIKSIISEGDSYKNQINRLNKTINKLKSEKTKTKASESFNKAFRKGKNGKREVLVSPYRGWINAYIDHTNKEHPDAISGANHIAKPT